MHTGIYLDISTVQLCSIILKNTIDENEEPGHLHIVLVEFLSVDHALDDLEVPKRYQESHINNLRSISCIPLYAHNVYYVK